MSFHTTLRLELAHAQGMLRNGDSDDAYQGTVDALRAAYGLVRPFTVLEHGLPLAELSRPHPLVYARFHQNAATALRHVDNAMLSVDDLLSGTFSGTEIYNDIAAEILDALEVLLAGMNRPASCLVARFTGTVGVCSKRCVTGQTVWAGSLAVRQSAR